MDTRMDTVGEVRALTNWPSGSGMDVGQRKLGMLRGWDLKTLVI